MVPDGARAPRPPRGDLEPSGAPSPVPGSPAASWCPPRGLAWLPGPSIARNCLGACKRRLSRDTAPPRAGRGAHLRTTSSWCRRGAAPGECAARPRGARSQGANPGRGGGGAAPALPSPAPRYTWRSPRGPAHSDTRPGRARPRAPRCARSPSALARPRGPCTVAPTQVIRVTVAVETPRASGPTRCADGSLRGVAAAFRVGVRAGRGGAGRGAPGDGGSWRRRGARPRGGTSRTGAGSEPGAHLVEQGRRGERSVPLLSW